MVKKKKRITRQSENRPIIVPRPRLAVRTGSLSATLRSLLVSFISVGYYTYYIIILYTYIIISYESVVQYGRCAVRALLSAVVSDHRAHTVHRSDTDDLPLLLLLHTHTHIVLYILSIIVHRVVLFREFASSTAPSPPQAAGSP